MDKSTSRLREEMRLIEELKHHKGWALLRAQMEREILESAMGIASSVDMSPKEIDFRRGTIFAAKQAISMPDNMLAKLNNELVFAEATGATKKKDDTASS